MGLWRQLINPSVEHSPLATKLWTDMDSGQKQRGEVRTGRLLEIVEAEMQESSRIFFLVDALDEFPEASQQELISSLKSLQSKSHCNLMVTSRKLDSIAQIFDKDPEIQIDAQNDDLVTYITGRIQETPFQKVKQKYAAMEADVLKEVIPKCDKMFLLARLYMDSLSTQTRVSHFKNALKTLPTGLQTMYDDALNRIAADVPHTEDALKVLYWVSFAKRPLTVDELIHALAVTLEDKDYDADNELLDEITSICAGLLIVDPISCVVRLAHHTTDEYLKKTQTKSFPGISSHIASVLLTYVSFDAFKTQAAVTRADASNTLRQYPLLEYAATNWGHHFSESDGLGNGIRLRALEYLKRPQRFPDFLIKETIEKEHGAGLPGTINGTHIAVVFDLLEFIPALQTSDPQQRKTESPMPSPLWTAAMFGKARAVELLIAGGADVNGTSGYPVKALHRAAGTGGSLEICRLLIEHGADVNAPFATDPVYESDVTWIRLQTPLHEAAWHNNPKIAALLLTKGADMYAMTSDHETPWDFAVHCRSFETLDVLIEAFQGPGHWSKMIIQSLVRSGSTELIDSMVKKGLDVNEISRHGKRALDLALDIGDENVITVLLENGAVSHYPWSQTQMEVASFSDRPWFDLLCRALFENRLNWQPNVQGGHTFEERSWQPPLIITRESPIEPHLSLTVPGDIVLPVKTIVFKTVSLDQGWSDFQYDHGTYSNSQTFFDFMVRLPDRIGVDDSERSTSPVRSTNTIHISNLHASPTWRTHTNIWHRTEVSAEIRACMDRITHGSTIEITARAGYLGWQKHVSVIRVDIYGSKPSQEAIV